MSQIHILDGQKDIILDYITENNIISDDHKNSLEETLETYDFITFADKRFSEHLQKRNRIIIPDEDGSLVEFVIFEAAKYKDTEGYKAQVFANASYLELKKASIIYPDSGFTGTASQHGGRALNNTGWQIGIVEGKGTRTLTINNHTNPYEMLKRIAREFDLELKFRIEHDGNKVTGRYVDLLERVGQWRGREVEFGKDLDGIRRVEKQDIVTALLGLGPEREDGTRLEVLVTDEDALQRWGRLDEHGNLQHLIEPYEIQSERSEMTETEARQYTRTALNKRINTQITYETTIVDLEEVPGMENKKIRFGDTIKIKDTSFNPPLYLEARVFEQSRSIKSKAKKDIKLGDFIEYTEEEVNVIWEQLKKQIQNRISYYEMVEYTYDKLTIDDKDEIVFEGGKSFAEATGITAEENAKAYAVEQDGLIKVDLEAYADTVSEQNAQSALDQAKIYAVAETVYNQQMKKIADDIADRAPIEYVDGELRHAIDGLVIGGRNLLRDTALTHTGRGAWLALPERHSDDDFLYVEQAYSWGVRQQIPLLKAGTYTISTLVKEGTRTSSRMRYSMTGVSDGVVSHQLNDEWQKVSLTFTISEDIQDFNIYFLNADSTSGSARIKMAQFQLEKGNKATDWSPAPEDMFSEIEKKADGSTVYTIEQIDNKINNLVSVTQYTADMDGVVTELNSQGTRIGQNEDAIGLKADASHVDSVENELTRKIGNVEVTAEGASLTASEVRADLDGLEIGGRNTLPNSNDFSHFTGYNGASVRRTTKVSVPEWGAKDATRLLFSGGDGVLKTTPQINAEPGSIVTYSFWIKNEGIRDITLNFNGLTILQQNRSLTFTPDEMARIIVIGRMRTTHDWFQHQLRTQNVGHNLTVLLWRAQLEYGNKATDWSPAPEDTDEAINNVSGRVTRLDSEIQAVAGEVRLKASQSIVDSLEGRVSTAEGELRVLPGQINAKVSKDGVVGAINATPERLLIDFDKVKMSGELEAKHIKSLNGLNVNNQFVVDNNGNVRFSGNLQGATGTFSGKIQAPQLTVEVQNSQQWENFGLRLQTAEWQPSTTNPYKSSGYVLFETKENGIHLYKENLNGSKGPMDGFLIEARNIIFDGSIYVGAGGSGGASRSLMFHSDHFITTSATNDNIVIAPNRMFGGFEVRSHINRASYRNEFEIRASDGLIVSMPTANRTSTGSANMRVGESNGLFVRASSSAKYKLVIEDIKVDPYKILDVDPRDWYDKENIETYAECLSCGDLDKLKDVENIRRTPGLVAEEVQAAGLEQFVEYSVTGEVEGVMYDRLWTLLIPIIKDLKNELEELKNGRSNV